MKHTKFLRNFVSLAMLFGMVACGGSGATSSEPTSEPPSIPPTSEVPTSEDPTTVDPTSEEISSEEIDYGQLIIEDVDVVFMGEVIINPVFTIEEYEEDIEYAFEGNDISINDGKIKGLVPGTVTEVNATTSHHSTTFEVSVKYVEATLTNDTGAESKFALPVPEENQYVLHADVVVDEYINDYTRFSSFAYNASNNSWYNIEMGGDGNLLLFAKFNGVEKYWIFLANKNDLMVEGKIQYHVDVLRNGQATAFYFNGKLVAGFTVEEMAGYAELGALEVTAAADRASAGKYVINLCNVYYEGSQTETYQKMLKGESSYEETIIANENGAEAKFSYGNVGVMQKNIIYTTTVDVEAWSGTRTRPLALAFNGSDNSWYNIEMGAEGEMHLFARFNGVEKYWIFLGNRSEFMINDKIHFEVALLKQGQSTFYFFNDRLMAWYTERELQGYAKLDTLEATAATGFWAADPYRVVLSDTKIEADDSETYALYMNKVYKDYPDATLKNENGAEQRAPEIAVTDNMLYTCTVKVNQDSTGWFRPSAFAFNNSDNSWYNIETDSSGNMTLFAKFNGVEKYWISLGTKADTTKDDVFAYDIAILKEGQATYFFYNGVLKAFFTVEELGDYRGLFALNITSCADRSSSAFETQLLNQKVEDSNSENYQYYKALVTE